MRWQNREGSQNVEDRRGSGSGSDGGGKTPGFAGFDCGWWARIFSSVARFIKCRKWCCIAVQPVRLAVLVMRVLARFIVLLTKNCILICRFTIR